MWARCIPKASIYLPLTSRISNELINKLCCTKLRFVFDGDAAVPIVRVHVSKLCTKTGRLNDVTQILISLRTDSKKLRNLDVPLTDTALRRRGQISLLTQ